MDLVIKGGTVVTASDTFVADVAIAGGRIAALGTGLTGERVIDASGLYVMPGAVDPHTHIDSPYEGSCTSDDFYTGTVAAAAGGVTTVINFAMQQPGQGLGETLRQSLERAAGQAVIDYGFHLAVCDWSPALAAEWPSMVAAGVPSLKAFMAYLGAMLDDRQLYSAMRTTAAQGSLLMLHCENGPFIEALIAEAVAAGRLSPADHAKTRPMAAEAEAVGRAIRLAEAAGASLYIVHTTCGEAVAAISRAQQRGLPVYGETCPQYLGILDDSCYDRPPAEAGRYICSPPLRPRAEADHLWTALRQGVLAVVSSDHCPYNRLDAPHDFTQAPNGLPTIETRLPLLYSEGVAKGRISLNRFVELVATGPARLFGLSPRKGSLAPGADADVLLFDPERRVTIRHADLHERVDYTPYEGVEVVGWPAMTLSRGEVIWDGRQFLGRPGRGRFLPRSAHYTTTGGTT